MINPLTAIADISKSVSNIFTKKYEAKTAQKVLPEKYKHIEASNEQLIDLEIQRSLDKSYKDEFLLPLITSPLIIGFIITVVSVFSLSSAFISGTLMLGQYVSELNALTMILPNIIAGLPQVYQFILLCVVFSSFGITRFLPLYFQIKSNPQSNQRTIKEKIVYVKEEPDRILETIKKHEGYVRLPYHDIRNVLTIGHGTNLKDGVSKKEASLLANSRLKEAREDVKSVLFNVDLSDDVEDALTEIVYWIGLTKFLKFEKTIASIKQNNLKEAKGHFMDSKLYREFTTRAKTIADKIYKEN